MVAAVKWEVSKKQIEKALKTCNGSMTEAAKSLGLSRSTLYAMVGRLKVTKPDSRIKPVAGEAPSVADRYDLDFFKKRTQQLEKELVGVNQIRKEIFKLKDANIDIPQWMLKDRTNQKHRTLIPQLFTSDFQWGEVIIKDEMDGINEYNVAIAKARYRELITATVDICTNYLSQSKYPGMIYLRGGDTISGDIHEELRMSNELTSPMQVYDVVCEEARGIEHLADVFGQLVVISVPGNHGRTTIKPASKTYSEANYDYLASLLLEKIFEKDKRIKFYTPVSGDFYYQVYGTRYLLTHGDRIGSSGGQGFIGPAATIMRGIKKTRDQFASVGKIVDYVLLGHYHTSMKLPHGVVNGSLPGYSEYAKRFRMDPEPPSQTLLFTDPKYGLEQVREIRLDTPRLGADGGWFKAA